MTLNNACKEIYNANEINALTDNMGKLDNRQNGSVIFHNYNFKETSSVELCNAFIDFCKRLQKHLLKIRGLSQKFVDNMDNFVQTCGKNISRPQLFCPLY